MWQWHITKWTYKYCFHKYIYESLLAQKDKLLDVPVRWIKNKNNQWRWTDRHQKVHATWLWGNNVLYKTKWKKNDYQYPTLTYIKQFFGCLTWQPSIISKLHKFINTSKPVNTNKYTKSKRTRNQSARKTCVAVWLCNSVNTGWYISWRPTWQVVVYLQMLTRGDTSTMTGSSSKENRSALTSLALSMYITTGPSTAVSVNVDWLTVELMSHVSTVDDMLITITKYRW